MIPFCYAWHMLLRVALVENDWNDNRVAIGLFIKERFQRVSDAVFQITESDFLFHRLFKSLIGNGFSFLDNSLIVFEIDKASRENAWLAKNLVGTGINADNNCNHAIISQNLPVLQY